MPIVKLATAAVLFGTIGLASPAHANGQFIGEIQTFGFPSCPQGWLLTNGQALPTTGAYHALFSLIGHRYGGTSNRFNLPHNQPIDSIDGKVEVQCIAFEGAYPRFPVKIQ